MFLILGGTHLTTLGAKSSKQQPWSQWSDQNRVLSPFPTEVTIEMANVAEVFMWTGIFRPAHTRSGLAFFNTKPPHLQGPPHDFYVVNSQSSQLKRSHHFFPGHQAAATIYLLPAFPQEPPSNFVKGKVQFSPSKYHESLVFNLNIQNQT